MKFTYRKRKKICLCVDTLQWIREAELRIREAWSFLGQADRLISDSLSDINEIKKNIIEQLKRAHSNERRGTNSTGQIPAKGISEADI